MPQQEVDVKETEVSTKEAQQDGLDAAAEAAAIQQAADEPVSRAELEQTKAEVAQLKGERDQLVDRVARLQAEFENARKRAEREKAEFRDFAVGNAVEQFLPVLDNFELALKAKGTAEQMRSGVELIVKQMEEVLRQMQVTAIPTVGEPFDPRVHEALGSVERDDLPDQHVAEEIRRGYKVRERLLRPAMVRVVSNPKQVNE
ncbi:MAG TPA: nucleotide exchange factor GrpE [Terracidiphilus sp.]|jgi:molecular chaperone GrpE